MHHNIQSSSKPWKEKSSPLLHPSIYPSRKLEVATSMSMSRLGVVLLFVLAALQLQAVVHGDDQSPTIEPVSNSNDDCDWGFAVRTGMIDGAGTDAHITFELKFANGHRTIVTTSTDGRPWFEAGNEDKFTFYGPCMKPCSLSLSVWNEGTDSDWFPQSVYVEVSRLIIATQVFEVNQWVKPGAQPVVIDYCGHEKAIGA